MSNLIDRQAAIDATWSEPSYTDPLNVLTEVRDRLKALPSAQPEQRWISCNVALPKKNGQYIITVKYEHVDGYDDIYAEYGYWTGGRWDAEFGYYHCGMVEKVLAWMPLPTPYQEGDDKHEE